MIPIIKPGSWCKIEKYSREVYIANGSVYSPSALIQDSVEICSPVHFSPQVQVKQGSRIDKYTFLNWYTVIYPNVNIGAYCSLGRGVEVGLAQHPTNWLSTHSFQYSNGWFPSAEGYTDTVGSTRHMHHPKTHIGSDVWIGNGAKILSGVSVGHGAVIAAGAVVTKNVPPYAIVGGIPGKIIKYRFTEDVIASLLELKWWRFNVNKLKGIDFSNIDIAISELKKICC